MSRLKKSPNWLICAYAHQADYLNAIYPNAANTLRMIVLRSAETGEFELCFAVQRIGAAWTGAVDNGSRGGLVANVDLDIIAWDILPTAEGFTVIEANTSSGVNIIQLWGPQRYGRLGDFYREHGIIK